MALTKKMIRFCEEYIIDLNATQAAIRAGYSNQTAYSIAHENLRKPEIMEYIQKLMNKRSERVEITADMVLAEYAKIGFSNITDFLRVGVTEVSVPLGDDVKKIEMQTVQVFDTDHIPVDKMRAVSEIKQTKDGIALKLHDKKGALDSIARHLGMFKDEIKLSGELKVSKLEDYF